MLNTFGLLVLSLSVVFELMIIYLSRKRLLTFRYSVGWLSVGLVASIAAAFISISKASPFEVSLNLGNSLVGLCVIFLLLMNVQLSISVSGITKQVNNLSEIVAIIDEEIRQGTMHSEKRPG